MKHFLPPLSCLAASLVMLSAPDSRSADISTAPIYKDLSAPISARVDDLLGRMTLKEKIEQLENRPAGRADEIEKIFQGQSFGCIHEMSMTAANCAAMYHYLQQYLLTRTRLGVPVLTGSSPRNIIFRKTIMVE